MPIIVTKDSLFEHLEIQQSCRTYFKFLAFKHVFPAHVDKILLWIHVNAHAEGVDREWSEYGHGQMPWYGLISPYLQSSQGSISPGVLSFRSSCFPSPFEGALLATAASACRGTVCP